MLSFGGVLSDTSWPKYDEAKTVDDEIELAVMMGGKIKAKIMVAADATEDAIKEIALSDAKVKEALAGKTIVKIIVVPGKLVNIVAK